uniref:Uncharacterized protein n=1 Tax=Marseillevirus LCMAC102 TaxID=2506603 RepID=A0A481YU13_9VIRU|nr:MAG: hypothetical protein LCMAC102_00500 [Marseillevirus LCMAC102]
MAAYDHSKNQDYVIYNDKSEIADLDLNVWRSTEGTIASGATGRHLYAFEPRHPAYYTCFGGRDPETHYIIGQERETHPDHSSRFGYARCKNGYCSGHWPGRYIESEVCSTYDPQPPAMAPERFYTAAHQGSFQDMSQATVDYDYWKNHGMNYPAWWAK